MSAPDLSVHTIPLTTPIVHLDAQQAFDLLDDRESNYAYWLSQADWAGAKICLLQCSQESPVIFCLLQFVFASTKIEDVIKAAQEKALTKIQIDQALMYAATFYGNMGNYKSFGDSKFIPQLEVDAMYTFLTAAAEGETKDQIDKLWRECADRMYSLTPRQRQIGLGADKGISAYFSTNCDEEDAKIANAFLDSQGISAYNTRLFKDPQGKYRVRQASVTKSKGPSSTHTFEGKDFEIWQGDYSPLMGRVVDALTNALEFTANPNQTKMIEAYINSFTTGSIDAHKDASRHWIRDKGPEIESYIGFIESYRDPSGVRGEWEGFCACVNKKVSRQFQLLVDRAESFLEKMPWPKEFEKDTFLRPDFTSLDVLSFGSSGVPAGINIPNYDDIRQSEGFKNVSLGNVLHAKYSVAADQRVSFIKDEDQDLYKKLKSDAFEVQVGIHELLGHGSGKLYHQDTDDAKAMMDVENPVTKAPIIGPFYAPGATWGSTFGKLAPTYEECRAECTGIYLSLESSVLEVFGVEHKEGVGSSVSDVTYINWLMMVRAGLTGLEFFTPSTKEWRQAHMNARYVILRLLLQAGEDFLKIEQITNIIDGKPDVDISLNRALIPTIGKRVIGDFLLKLQVYKSLGDAENGSKMYNDLSIVPDDMFELRKIIMDRKEPRRLLIQPHLKKTADNGIELNNFSHTTEGMVGSFAARYPKEDTELMDLYHDDKNAM
jgi:dipeptidyl-peptidase-3